MKMLKKRYQGVPRSQISWGPTIDYDRCISCGKCVDYCTLGVYKFVEKEGKKRPVVENYNNCVVFCTGCQEQCPVGAISHPSRNETREAIKKLAEAQNLKQSKAVDTH
jgi:NAD-dependent dihydropyrimidine dehydrogenase PreA subunit